MGRIRARAPEKIVYEHRSERNRECSGQATGYMRRLLRALVAIVVLTGGLTAGGVTLLAGPAGATTCVAPASCSMTGTAGLTAGSLSLTTSGWASRPAVRVSRR